MAGTVSVLTNGGDGSFQTKRDYPTGSSPRSVAIGDLTGDGNLDLAVANYGIVTNEPGSVSVFANRGDGSFQAKLDYQAGRGSSSVAIGDLNGDGKPDLAAANALDDTVSVFANRGDGSLQARRDYRTGVNPDNGNSSPVSVAIGDLNGDGKPDLATANYRANTVSVFVNGGDLNFRRRDYASGNGPISLAIGNLNGDRKPDMVIANANRNTVSVLANTTGLCAVPNVKGRTLPAAKRAIVRAGCRVGKIGRAYSKIVEVGRVISERPRSGTLLRRGGKVNLVVSRGRKH